MKFKLIIEIPDNLVEKMEESCELHTCGACTPIDIIIDSIDLILKEKFGFL